MSIAVGVPAIIKLGTENNFDVDTTTNADKFTYQNLKQYAAVIFLNTTGDVLNDTQQGEFEKYIRGGGGFVGVHSATDTEYDWAWYGNLVGAYFKSHPAQQNATFTTWLTAVLSQPNTCLQCGKGLMSYIISNGWHRICMC